MNKDSKEYKALLAELSRQFGKKDASMMILAPRKYSHHFDSATQSAFKAAN